MANLKAAFDAAVASSKQLPEKPDNMTLLKIYYSLILRRED